MQSRRDTALGFEEPRGCAVPMVSMSKKEFDRLKKLQRPVQARAGRHRNSVSFTPHQGARPPVMVGSVAITQIRQCHRGGCGRAKSTTPGTTNRTASATSSPVVKSSALACSTNSREMVIVTFA